VRCIWVDQRREVALRNPIREFDEASYLAANPDVATAVAAGAFASGAQHYAIHGIHEKRRLFPGGRTAPLTLPFPQGAYPDRRDKILANLDLESLEGLEIGALASPLVRPREGNIFFVDYTDAETLKQKYANDPSVDTANIVDVDAIWGARSLQECIGVDKKVDYVVASHVVEHVPDLITWLSEIRSILRSGGTLRLAVPDRRYTFDYVRFETRIHDVVDAYLQKARAPLPRLVMEFFSQTCFVDCVAAWSGTLEIANLRRYNSLARSLALAEDALVNGSYHDVHCWVFTPASFAELCIEMAEVDLLGFACEHYIETARNELEFFVHMAPSDDKGEIIKSWTRMKTSLP
jgi:SAM-dependent methyltransferase